MEMCYDGALVMPKNYVAVTEEEMTYVDGGTKATLINNLKGLYNRYSEAKRVLRASGLDLKGISALANCSYWYLVSFVGAKVGSIAVVSRTLAAVAFVTGVAAGIYLYNKRVFY